MEEVVELYESREDEILDRLERLINNYSFPEVMDGKTAAKFLSISYDSLMRLARVGEIPCKNYGSKRVFTRENLLRWANGRT